MASTVVFVLGIVLILAGVVAFVVIVIPGQIESLYGAISSISPEVASRNLAGLITISAAAPNEIDIEYQPSSTETYDVNIEKRTINVKLVDEKYGMKGEIISKAAIDSVCYFTETKCDFEGVNHFFIEKSIVDSGYMCNVDGGVA